MRDLMVLYDFIGGKEISKAEVMEYKNKITVTNAIASANLIIAAVNVFMRFMGWADY